MYEPLSSVHTFERKKNNQKDQFTTESKSSNMHNIPIEPQQKGVLGNLKYSSPQSPSSPSYQTPSSYDANIVSNNDQEPTLQSSLSRISPLILLVIIVLAVIFFVYGLVHLILWFIMKIPSSHSLSLYNSNRFYESSSTRTRALQRQLQQLFRMHDSGLDQSLIDSLPVFYYQHLLNLKEPFDCAVCLCEFSDDDKLRLVPICSHAFHMNCLDTWLLSNSTCPLCRATISSSSMENHYNPMFSSENSCVVPNGLRAACEEESNNGSSQVIAEEEQGYGKRVFSVRLGKFRNSDVNGGEVVEGSNNSSSSSSSSSCGFDVRRCYSMGSYQYVVRDSNLQVVLSESHDEELGEFRSKYLSDVSENGDLDGKKIGNSRNKGESFSVSKIWLWSKKSKYHSSNGDFP